MKNQKPLSSKKPPAPLESRERIEAWIADTKPSLNPIVTELDKRIRQALKAPRYAIKWGKAYYGSEETGWCIEIVAYDVSVRPASLVGPGSAQSTKSRLTQM